MEAVLILKTEWFEKFARKERISDQTLVAAIRRVEKGLVDADLGSGLIKQRVARLGQGKSGGYRAIVIFRQKRFAVFMFGFAKSSQANLTDKELAKYRLAAERFLEFSDEVIQEMIRNGSLVEVNDGKDVPK